MKFSSLLAKTSCALALFFGCSAAWAQQPGYRMVYNNDGTDMLGNYWFNNRPLTVADLDSCVSLVAATGATTYQMCSGSDLMTYESSFARFIGDDVNGTLRCGDNTAAFNANNLFYRNYVHLKKEGADMIRHSLQKAKEKGMETMVTYRMNDLHFADTTSRCPIHYPEFWLQHPQYWVGDTLQGYHSFYALDFSHPEVRQHRMNLIKEQLLKYADVMDGYELDFMRFFVYFPTYKGQYHCEEMTELVRQVRHLADSVGALHHKRLLLSARVGPTLYINRQKGLDIRKWLQEGLLDFISIGTHWRGDPQMAASSMRDSLSADLRIPLYASIDDGGYKPREFWSHGQLRGMAAYLYYQKADGLYLFNAYFGDWNNAGQQLKLAAGGQVCRIRTPEVYHEMASPESLRKRNKVFCLSDSVNQYEVRHNTPLPLHLTGTRPEQSASICIADPVEKDKPQEIILFFRTSKAADLKVQVNGKDVVCRKPDYPALYDRLIGLSPQQYEYAFVLPAKAVRQGDNVISFRTAEPCDVDVIRLEVALKYGPVSRNGYF